VFHQLLEKVVGYAEEVKKKSVQITPDPRDPGRVSINIEWLTEIDSK
jgi:hypothetical protein